MGFLDTLKKAADTVTGGGAKLVLTPITPVAIQGQELAVIVSVQSTGQEVGHLGVWLDLVGVETITAKLPTGADISTQKESLRQSFKLSAPAAVPAGQLAHVPGSFLVPAALPPTYEGPHAKHVITLVARLDLPGLDSVSSPVTLTVLKKP
jgi:hypothetical protein